MQAKLFTYHIFILWAVDATDKRRTGDVAGGKWRGGGVRQGIAASANTLVSNPPGRCLVAALPRYFFCLIYRISR